MLYRESSGRFVGLLNLSAQGAGTRKKKNEDTASSDSVVSARLFLVKGAMRVEELPVQCAVCQQGLGCLIWVP